MNPPTLGTTAHIKVKVTAKITAQAVGSGDMAVLATPELVCLLEQAAVKALHPYLSENETSVGTEIAVSHQAPTPIGMEVTAQAKITAYQDRLIRFELQATDQAGLIATGTHTRVRVNRARFTDKAQARLTGS